MVKRKLRSCAACGGRHGPPTGKGCARLTEEKQKETEKKSEAATDSPKVDAMSGAGVEKNSELFGETIMDPESEDEQHIPFSSFCKHGVAPNYGVEDDFRQMWASDSQAERRAHTTDQTTSNGAPPAEVFLGRVPAETLFEKRIADKVEHMENVMGRVAGVQQAQLRRLIDLLEVKSVEKKEDKTEPAASATPACKVETSPKPATPKVREESTKWELPRPDSPTEQMKPAEEEWREYHGEVLWQKEKDKKRKNPFDHQAYIKKGDEVDTFEVLMVVTFKTLKQLVDLKYDVSGLIRHGRSLAEKAAKGSYKKHALIGYDESVRERAGELGPAAFGVVEYDDVFRFFCADNTVPKKMQTKESVAKSKVKSDKICHRYNNDMGCQSKTCIYAHKCASCELWGHPQKECRKGEKKKEAK